jgi:sulfotransferase family protein
MRKLPPEQIMLLRYEDLLAAPEATVRRLCTFLGEKFEEKMLEYHHDLEAKKSGSLSISWENTAKPVITGNSGKFLNQLTEREILQFEAIVGDELQNLGYQTINQPEYLLPAREKLTSERTTYRLTELFMKLKTETVHLLKDRNSGARIRKILFMKYLGIARRLASPDA